MQIFATLGGRQIGIFYIYIWKIPMEVCDMALMLSWFASHLVDEENMLLCHYLFVNIWH